MSKLNIELPNSLHRAVAELADSDQISIDHFIVYALTEKVASMRTVDYLKERAAQANIADFDRLLAMVPDAEPDEHDRIPPKA